jgi:hypothetical protein
MTAKKINSIFTPTIVLVKFVKLKSLIAIKKKKIETIKI